MATLKSGIEWDKLPEVLGGHMVVRRGPSNAAYVCQCSTRLGQIGSAPQGDLHAAHLAAVVREWVEVAVNDNPYRSG